MKHVKYLLFILNGVLLAQDFSTVSIDEVKNFWNKRPCNIRHSNKIVGSLEYFDEVEQRKYFVEPHIPVFAEFKKWQGKRVLEIGCTAISADAKTKLRWRGQFRYGV